MYARSGCGTCMLSRPPISVRIPTPADETSIIEQESAITFARGVTPTAAEEPLLPIRAEEEPVSSDDVWGHAWKGCLEACNDIPQWAEAPAEFAHNHL